MRILVAENDDRTRSALHKLLAQEPGLALGGCSDLGELVERVRAFRPDLLLLDWELPGRPAAALLFALNQSAVNQVIVLSRRPEAERAALEAGANAFVCKSDPPQELLGALRRLVESQSRQALKEGAY